MKDGAAVTVPHLLWTIIGGIQPDRVASQLIAGDDDGLTARFLYTWPDPVPPRRPPCTPDDQAALAALARLRALSWPDSPEPVWVPFAEPAAQVMAEWRQHVAEWETAATGLLLSWIGKMPGFALRIATILQHLDWCAGGGPEPAAIGRDAMLRAIEWLEDYALPMARRTFGEAALPQVEKDARRLARWLVQQRPVPAMLNAKALRRMASGPGIPDVERMSAALADLAAANWLRRAPANNAGQGGRSRADWEVNPAIEGFVP